MGKRITELQKQTQHESRQPDAGQSEESQLDAAGTMLLSEVDLGGGGHGVSAEPPPSSEVQLTDGRIVRVVGNVSKPGCQSCKAYFLAVRHIHMQTAAASTSAAEVLINHSDHNAIVTSLVNSCYIPYIALAAQMHSAVRENQLLAHFGCNSLSIGIAHEALVELASWHNIHSTPVQIHQ